MGNSTVWTVARRVRQAARRLREAGRAHGLLPAFWTLPLAGLGGAYLWRHACERIIAGRLAGPAVHDLPPVSDAVTNAALGGGLTWYNLYCLHLALCLGAAVVGLTALRELLDTRPRRFRVTFLGAAALAGLAVLSAAPAHPASDVMLGRTIGGLGGLPEIIRLCGWVDRSGYGAAVILTAAASAVLLNPAGGLAPADLARRLRLLQTLLYAGMVVFVSTVLTWTDAFRWALTYVAPWDGEAHRSLEQYVSGSVLGRGIYYSLLLATIYLPCAYLLGRRGRSLLQTEVSRGNVGREAAAQEKWLADNALTSSIAETLPRLAAILGPLLTGSLPELLKTLSEH